MNKVIDPAKTVKALSPQGNTLSEPSPSSSNNPGDLPPNSDLPRAYTITDLQDPKTREVARKALAGKAGIYCVRCLKTGMCYIGSSVNLYTRFCAHILHNNTNSHLQNAIAKYGLESFEFFIIDGGGGS